MVGSITTWVVWEVTSDTFHVGAVVAPTLVLMV